ncbi:MAG: TIGR01212 family radical SAM protein [Planctomycetes bacterium]|nr:TIGR01212 family radical SAM protein [Planctomycetota bacterium]
MKEGGLPRYPTFGEWARERYGRRVRKIMVNAGLTCPNRDGTRGTGGCTYCDNNAFSPLLGGTLTEQARQQINRMKKPPGGVVVYLQPYSNTYAPVDKLRELYREAIGIPSTVALAIGTRPDCIDGPILELLDELSTEVDIILETGIQTANDETLRRINRCHTWGESKEAFRLLKNHPGILTVAHLIIGLPGEEEQDMVRTAKEVAGLGPHGIKLHHLQIVRGTRVADEYAKGAIRPLQVEEYVELAVKCIRQFPPGTVLHRLVGEVMGDLLTAPVWSVTKQAVSSRILAEVR